MAYEEILYDVSERVATITLNRPDRLNAWTATMDLELRNAVKAAAADDGVRAIILTGAGRGFCAGADMGNLSNVSSGGGRVGPGLQSEPDFLDAPVGFRGRVSYFAAVPKPVIAAVNGPCAGIGMVAALFCDIRFASSEALFTTAFSRRGLIAEYGIAWILPQLIGRSSALDLLLSARKVGGEEAARLGLVSQVVPHEELLPTVRNYARELVEYVSPRSMAVMKRQVWGAASQSLAEATRIAEEEMAKSFQSQDFKEGVSHFVEKRKPAFTGK
ncbi:MAG TPA: enoyl-CoA hydratase [Aliidongia sp.]|nr:enoyl-CoA hydratase [Aliidongia sp.]